jgi:hypothetical protein
VEFLKGRRLEFFNNSFNMKKTVFEDVRQDEKNDETFARDYIVAWSTEEDATRATLISELYAEDAVFYSDEADGPVVCRGIAEITANIKQVNVRLVQGAGLDTKGTGFAANNSALKVSWKMLNGEGNIALSGMNMLLRNKSGKIAQDYIFINT